MIDLNKKYEAKEYTPTNFDPIPEGDYILEVVSIPDWKEKTASNVPVYEKDERDRRVLDENGKPIIIDKIPTLKYYETGVKLKVVGGEHDGRFIFHNLSTHPHRDFVIPALLFGLGISGVSAKEIPTACIGKRCEASIVINIYTKKEIDKTTGLEKDVEKMNNRIKTFKKPETTEQGASSDLGL